MKRLGPSALPACLAGRSRRRTTRQHKAHNGSPLCVAASFRRAGAAMRRQRELPSRLRASVTLWQKFLGISQAGMDGTHGLPQKTVKSAARRVSTRFVNASCDYNVAARGVQYMRMLRAISVAAASLVLLPTLALAQASIAGVVKDTSGAVLPGVTVEAASPVLIEKARTAVTDGSGQYRIVDLRAGTYVVTFTLTGFSTVKRDGIQLEGAFTAVVNADLKVGAVAETITVTAETPVVDTQSVRRQTTIGSDLITSVPAARSYAGLMTLMPNTVVAS